MGSIFLLSSLIITSLGVVVIVVVFSYQKRLLNEQLRFEKERLKQRVEMFRATVQAQEQERGRIARELHDGAGNTLLAARLQLLRHGEQRDEVPGYIREVDRLLEEGVEAIRQAAYDLMPAALEKLGLVEALKELVDELRLPGGSKVRLRIDAVTAGERLPHFTELNLYRMVQEFIGNTIKHAQATEAELKLGIDRNEVRLEYSDNGIGFTPAGIRNGMGLKNLESRASLLNATWQINSSGGGGTHMLLNMQTPFAAKE